MGRGLWNTLCIHGCGNGYTIYGSSTYHLETDRSVQLVPASGAGGLFDLMACLLDLICRFVPVWVAWCCNIGFAWQLWLTYMQGEECHGLQTDVMSYQMGLYLAVAGLTVSPEEPYFSGRPFQGHVQSVICYFCTAAMCHVPTTMVSVWHEDSVGLFNCRGGFCFARGTAWIMHFILTTATSRTSASLARYGECQPLQHEGMSAMTEETKAAAWSSGSAMLVHHMECNHARCDEKVLIGKFW